MEIYLDNAATSHPKPPEVISAVCEALTDLNGNPPRAAIVPMSEDWVTNKTTADKVLGRFEDANGDGTPDRLVVQWTDIQYILGSPPVTFQAAARASRPPSQISSARRGNMRVWWRSGGSDRRRRACSARSSATSFGPTESLMRWSTPDSVDRAGESAQGPFRPRRGV